MKTAISKLAKLGFSNYEARAYTALLQDNPLTAYEIAKMANISVPEATKVLIGEVTSVELAEPFSHEKLSPVCNSVLLIFSSKR